MTAREALAEMRGRSQYAKRQRVLLWATAIEAELNSEAEKCFMEAAMLWCGIEYSTRNVIPPTGHELELVDAYRALMAEREASR